MAVETVSNLIFTGPLAWTSQSECSGQTDLFFAPVIEYGPLSAWKAILGERGHKMQAAFNQLRDRIDAACQGPLPFVLTIRAACLRARKPAPPPPLSFEEDPENAPTHPGS